MPEYDPYASDNENEPEFENRFNESFFNRVKIELADYNQQLDKLRDTIRRAKFDGRHSDLKNKYECYWNMFAKQLDVFDKVNTLFKDSRNFHNPCDSDIDSEFSEGEEKFDYSKTVPKEGKRNLCIACFQNFRQRCCENVRYKLATKPPIKWRSGYQKISMHVEPYEDDVFPPNTLPQLKIRIESEGCQTRDPNFRGSRLISGFVNLAHSSNSHNDLQFPLYLKDQVIYISEEEVLEYKLVIKDDDPNPTSTKSNSLRMDFCINKVVKCDGLLDRVYINDVKNWKQKILAMIDAIGALEMKINRGVIERTPEEVEDEKRRILQENRSHALKSQSLAAQEQTMRTQRAERVWENSQIRPENVAIGGPALLKPIKKDEDNDGHTNQPKFAICANPNIQNNDSSNYEKKPDLENISRKRGQEQIEHASAPKIKKEKEDKGYESSATQSSGELQHITAPPTDEDRETLKKLEQELTELQAKLKSLNEKEQKWLDQTQEWQRENNIDMKKLETNDPIVLNYTQNKDRLINKKITQSKKIDKKMDEIVAIKERI